MTDKLLDKYEDDTEHNHVIGVMFELIARGIATTHGYDSDTKLYINYLLEKLRR